MLLLCAKIKNNTNGAAKDLTAMNCIGGNTDSSTRELIEKKVVENTTQEVVKK
jgi:hypothetical protein